MRAVDVLVLSTGMAGEVRAGAGGAERALPLRGHAQSHIVKFHSGQDVL